MFILDNLFFPSYLLKEKFKSEMDRKKMKKYTNGSCRNRCKILVCMYFFILLQFQIVIIDIITLRKKKKYVWKSQEFYEMNKSYLYWNSQSQFSNWYI
jgi:SUMO ligase MMS21 Smc5/6 complex component